MYCVAHLTNGVLYCIVKRFYAFFKDSLSLQLAPCYFILNKQTNLAEYYVCTAYISYSGSVTRFLGIFFFDKQAKMVLLKESFCKGIPRTEVLNTRMLCRRSH